ncbi:MAG TPA: hypothetical protein VG893_13125 [Terracidiphilus sp.]|nr:hypothetical protein [Terracidiphilus sp.]
MSLSSSASSSSRGGSFASLLAGFAAQSSDGSASRSHDGLEDDVATISYEQALRTHARRRPAAALGLPFEPDAEPETAVPEPAALPPRKPPVSVRISEWAPENWVPENKAAGQRTHAALAARRKSASITIRLSETECAQVHARAEAAGMTTSAYLRSCLFEAEALRTQVKEALEQFRAAAPAEEKKPVRSEQASRLSWLRSRWLGGESAKSA